MPLPNRRQILYMYTYKRGKFPAPLRAPVKTRGHAAVKPRLRECDRRPLLLRKCKYLYTYACSTNDSTQGSIEQQVKNAEEFLRCVRVNGAPTTASTTLYLSLSLFIPLIP